MKDQGEERKVLGRGRGVRQGDRGKNVWVCVYFKGQIYSRQIYLRFVCKWKQPGYDLLKGGSVRERRVYSQYFRLVDTQLPWPG